MFLQRDNYDQTKKVPLVTATTTTQEFLTLKVRKPLQSDVVTSYWVNDTKYL